MAPPPLRLQNQHAADLANPATVLSSDQRKYEYLRVLQANFEYHASSNLLLNTELADQLQQINPAAYANALAGTRARGSAGPGGQTTVALLSYALAVDSWLVDKLATTYNWFGGHKSIDLFNSQFGNHNTLCSVAHVVPLGAVDNFNRLPFDPTSRTTIIVDTALKGLTKTTNGGGGRTQKACASTIRRLVKLQDLLFESRTTAGLQRDQITTQVYLMKIRDRPSYRRMTPGHFDTTLAADFVTPYMRATYFPGYVLNAETDLVDRIGRFYSQSATYSMTNSTGTPPRLQIVLGSGKNTVFSFTALAVVIEAIRSSTAHNGVTHIEEGYMCLATHCDENPELPELRALNAERLDQIIYISLRTMRLLGRVAKQVHSVVPTLAQMTAAGAPAAESELALAIAAAVKKHSAEQVKGALYALSSTRWNDAPGSTLSTSRV